jgi:hypothetical protein
MVSIPHPDERLLTIPQVRGILIDLALERMDPVFLDIEAHLYRRPYVRRARQRSHMTPRIGLRIKELARDFPDAPYQWIADRAGVSIGRVSEVLAGRRSEA